MVLGRDLSADAAEKSSHQPMYLRIRQEITDRIDCGVYGTGEALPSENELALEFGTTRLTVRSAIDALVEKGLVRRVQGKGTYVSHDWVDDGARLGGFREVARMRNAVAEVRILSKTMRPAGNYYAHLFNIDSSDVLYSIRRLNSADGEPVSIENTLIPLSLFDGIELLDISVFSLFEAYEMLGHKVALSQEKLGVEALSTRDASLLQVASGDLAFVLESLSFDEQGQPVEYARSLTRGDRGGYSYQY